MKEEGKTGGREGRETRGREGGREGGREEGRENGRKKEKEEGTKKAKAHITLQSVCVISPFSSVSPPSRCRRWGGVIIFVLSESID